MDRKYTINSESSLWEDFINGDEDALRIIYLNHVQSLYKYGCNFTTDEDLVKDCIHDLFIDICKYRSRLGKTSNIRFYLLTSLKRKLVKVLCKRNVFQRIESENLAFHYSLSSEDELINDESDQHRSVFLERAMQNLSPRQKEAIYLKYVSELDYDEIGKLMMINYQSVRNLIFRGMEKLRQGFPKDIFLFSLFNRCTASLRLVYFKA